MTSHVPTFEDLEQMEIASTILVRVLRLTLKNPQAMDRETVAGMLTMAADERDRQGDYGAAKLLDHWAEAVGEPLRDGK